MKARRTAGRERSLSDGPIVAAGRASLPEVMEEAAREQTTVDIATSVALSVAVVVLGVPALVAAGFIAGDVWRAGPAGYLWVVGVAMLVRFGYLARHRR